MAVLCTPCPTYTRRSSQGGTTEALPRWGVVMLSWVFLGQNEMGGAALRTLLKRVDAPTLVLTRRPKSHRNEVFEVATGAGVRVLQVDGVNGRHPVIQELVACSPSVAVCAGWFERLSAQVLRIPLNGWLNLHPSPLPAWRGSDPIGWQLASGATEIGCSVHEMTEDVDTGRVVARGWVPVDPYPTQFDAVVARRRCGTELGRLVAGLLDGCVSPPAPLAPMATNCPPRGVVPFLQPSELTAQRMTSAVNAFSPFPGVGVAGLAHRRVIRARRSDLAEDAGSVGDIRLAMDGAQVRCRDGWVEVDLGGRWR